MCNKVVPRVSTLGRGSQGRYSVLCKLAGTVTNDRYKTCRLKVFLKSVRMMDE
jgi:hypothetical protein